MGQACDPLTPYCLWHIISSRSELLTQTPCNNVDSIAWYCYGFPKLLLLPIAENHVFLRFVQTQFLQPMWDSTLIKTPFLVGEIPVAWCPWWTRTCFTISLANGDAMEFLIACRGGIAAAGSAPAVKNLWLGAVSWPTITDTSQIFCKSEERNSHPPGWHLHLETLDSENPLS